MGSRLKSGLKVNETATLNSLLSPIKQNLQKSFEERFNENNKTTKSFEMENKIIEFLKEFTNGRVFKIFLNDK